MQFTASIATLVLTLTSTVIATPAPRDDTPTFSVQVNATQSDIHNTRPDAIVNCTINTLCDAPGVVVSKLKVVPDSGTNQLNATAVECRQFIPSNSFDPTGAPSAGPPFDTEKELYVATNARIWVPVICYLRAAGEGICSGQFQC